MAFPVDPGEDFAVVTDGLDSVSVRQINPDSGATLATSTSVSVLKRAPQRAPSSTGFGGEVGAETCRFWIEADDLSFVPRTRDQITDADSVVWDILRVSVVALTELYVCDCIRSR